MLFEKVKKLTEKRDGRPGTMSLYLQDASQKQLRKWSLSLLAKRNPENLLEIGLGTGASLQAMLKQWPASHAIAIDHASQPVTMAARSNADAIKQGRCIVMEGEACHLPFPDDTFDLIIAFDSISSWRDLNNSVQDIYSELVKGGCFAIINADDKGPGFDESSLRPLLYDAGFSRVKAYRHEADPWLLLVAEKER
ncbi:MAG: class I SAM-dependent methyltransferase [Lactimicrobium sp.]|jgi:ubiquinone/menaquinone biosynthesis C-methylase UbiE|uniref:class I SAM-dependent methyltransferase n=1 Tax=Lactimicrobium sp. TaxID=2563780 RepID=UPI002F357600